MTTGRGTWSRPRRYDRNHVVIGAGSAGLVSAYLGPPCAPGSRWLKATAWAVIV